MNILLIGQAGSGKGTIAKEILKKFKIPCICVGDIFREIFKKKSKIALKAKFFVENGLLVPNYITNQLLKLRIQKKDCKNGFILDGYPRNLIQVKSLNKIFKYLKFEINLILILQVNKNILLKRILGRRICEKCGEIFHIISFPPIKKNICDECGNKLIHRKDDTEKKLKIRFNEYKKFTLSVIKYYLKNKKYKKKVFIIDTAKKKKVYIQNIFNKINFIKKNRKKKYDYKI